MVKVYTLVYNKFPNVRFGQFRAEKNAAVNLKYRFLREYSMDFDNSFFPGSAKDRSTG